jgi:hypothetical protein
MESRRASCNCGQLSVECEGVAAKVSICHCDDCRRRTGSAFGISAFFPRDRVAIAGASTLSRRGSGHGAAIDFHFCPHCGSTVYWEPARKPDLIGVAVGAFADPSYPAPDQSVWDAKRHFWVTFPAAVATRAGA